MRKNLPEILVWLNPFLYIGFVGWGISFMVDSATDTLDEIEEKRIKRIWGDHKTCNCKDCRKENK